MERVVGNRTDTGNTYFVTGFDLTPWQEYQISQVVVSYVKKPCEDQMIFAFKVNRGDTDSFRDILEKENINVLRG